MGTTYAKPYTAGELRKPRPPPAPMRVGNPNAGWKDPHLKTRNAGWATTAAEKKPKVNKNSKRVMDCSQRTNVGWKFAPSTLDYSTQWARTNSGWGPRQPCREYPLKAAAIPATQESEKAARKRRQSRGLHPPSNVGLGAQTCGGTSRPKPEPMRFTLDRKHGCGTANAGWSSYHYGSDAIPVMLMHERGSRPSSAATMRDVPPHRTSRPSSAARPSSASRTSSMHFALDPNRSLLSANAPNNGPGAETHFGPFNYKGSAEDTGWAPANTGGTLLSSTQLVLRDLVSAVGSGTGQHLGDTALERVLAPSPAMPMPQRPRSAMLGAGVPMV